jgi:MFS family permease
MFTARLLSRIGDHLAKVAIAILVYDRTGSTALAATTYALTFLPWLVGTPLLSAVGDRFPRRSVLVWCDLIRALLVLAMALPGLPTVGLLGLLGVVSLLAPPSDSTWSALLADVLSGDRYVVGSALSNVSSQLAQVVGFSLGGLLVALLRPRGVLVFDAATFLVSALLLRGLVQARPVEAAAPAGDHGRWREGPRLVAREPILRFLVLLAWVTAAFAIAPEGLAVAVVRQHGGSAVDVGLLTAAQPIGVVVGMLVVSRWVARQRRLRLLVPLGLLSVAPLTASAAFSSLGLLFALWALAGVGAALSLPSAAAFVAAVPAPLRARAFGVAQSGLAIIQGVGLIVVGLAAEHVAPLRVVAVSGALGTIGVCVVATTRFRDQRQSPRLGNAAVPAEGVADPHDPGGPGSVRAGW